jgi:outer membrane protein TolC
MDTRLIALALTISLTATVRAETLSFDQVLSRAFSARGIDTAFAANLARLEEPARTLPVVRVETTAQTTANVDLLTENATRFNALSAIVSVDYPLLDRQAGERRVARTRTEAQLFRRRALDEADSVFRETLDAYTQLYLAQQRLALFGDAAAGAETLRERAQTLLVSGRITNVVAANWEEQALATESARVDLDLQRLDAETRLKELMGDTSGTHVEATIDLDEPSARGAGAPIAHETVDREAADITKRQLDLDELRAQQRPQLLLSAFGGAASLSTPFSRTYGLYGLRLDFTLPSRDATRLAAAQLELEDAERTRDAAASVRRRRAATAALALDAAGTRITLLAKSVDLARQRQQSVARLVSGGVRTDSDLAEAAREIARRESDLLAARVERWKLARTLERMPAP